MAYVPPSSTTPSALRKRQWEVQQEVLAAKRASEQAKVAKVSLVKK